MKPPQTERRPVTGLRHSLRLTGPLSRANTVGAQLCPPGSHALSRLQAGAPRQKWPILPGCPAQQPVKKLWIPPFHQKPGAGEARRRRIPFMGLRLRSNEAAARFLMKPSGLRSFLALCFVAPRSQIHADMLPRRSAHRAKNPLSGGVHSFLTGC